MEDILRKGRLVKKVTVQADDPSKGMSVREIVQALSTGDIDKKANVTVRITMGGKIKSLAWTEGDW